MVLAGCQVRSTVVIDAGADGSGEVEVRVVLDRDAAARVPDLDVRVDDLVRAGWDVEPLRRQPGGGLSVAARHDFRSPAEADRLLDQVSGEGGVLQGFRLDRDRTFLETRTRLSGVIDLTGGVARFSDSDLAERLGGLPLGVDPAGLAPLDEALRLDVVAELPGGTSRWEARPGDQVPVAAVAEQWNVASIVLALLALLCAVACALAVRRVRRR